MSRVEWTAARSKFRGTHAKTALIFEGDTLGPNCPRPWLLIFSDWDEPMGEVEAETSAELHAFAAEIGAVVS